ncbi:MAG: carbohydrate ABC transporter permease [Defluviitaleaceae bacterium]|nr:carbohydrate ABC transporter permease [Defluviitaleaceae bacterium]
MTALRAWVNSPSFDNTVQKWTGKGKDLIIGICMAIIIIGVCYIILSPVIGIVSTAFMSVEDMMNPLIFLIPQNLTLSNLDYAVTHMQYFQGRGLNDFIIPIINFNVTQTFFSAVEGTFIYDAANFASRLLSGALLQTLLFSIFFSFLNVVVCSMVGYGFARFKFPGSNALFAIVIVTIVVPVHSYMVPMFLNFRYFLGMDWNLLNTWWAMGLLTATGVGLRSGLYIYIFRQFFRGLPKEIEEAAFIDGAGPLYTYTKVMMPNAVPAIVTVLLFSFVWHYNDTFYTSLLLNESNFLSVRLMALGPTFQTIEEVWDLGLQQMVVFGGVLLVIAPILIIYLFLQRYFVEGLERSGIVG